jgi:uncharacterized protein (TIGR01568 family)
MAQSSLAPNGVQSANHHLINEQKHRYGHHMHEPRAHPHVLLASSLNCSQPASQPELACTRSAASPHSVLLRLLLLLPSPQPPELLALSALSGLQFVRAELEGNNSLRSIPSTPSIHPAVLLPVPVPEMGKNGLVSIFSRLVDSAAPTSTSAAATPWQWSACGTNPQTTSFRAGAGGDDDEPCCTATPPTAAAAAASRSVHRKPAAMGRGAPPGEMYKTVNSVFLDDPAADDFFFSLAGDGDDEEEVAGLYLDDDDDDDGFSTTTASEEWSEEAVIRSLGRTSTDRFFFDPQPGPLPASNSILATTAAAAAETPARKKTVPVPVPVPGPTEEEDATATHADEGDGVKKQRQPTTAAAAAAAVSSSLAERSVAVAVDSGDPYGDFRASMEEMVSAHGLRDWAQLEELLAWYLRINGKQHHHLIVGAFVDLLLGLSTSSPSSSSSPPSSTAAETSTTTTSSTSTGCS